MRPWLKVNNPGEADQRSNTLIRKLLFWESYTSGAYSISTEKSGEVLDLYVEARESKSTLIVFHGSIPRVREHYPIFSGRHLAEAVGANLISISDPCLALGDIDLGWHLGTRGLGPLKTTLIPLVSHIINSIESKDLYFFGASGGAHPAIRIGVAFPDSTIILSNPRLSLERRPQAKTKQFLETVFGFAVKGNVQEDHLKFIKSLGETDAGELLALSRHSKVLLYQNLEDEGYLNGQVLPFLRSLPLDNSQLLIRFSRDGSGHQVIPTPIIREIIRGMISPSGSFQERARKVGFASVKDKILEAVGDIPNFSNSLSPISKVEDSNTQRLREENQKLRDELTVTKRYLKHARRARDKAWEEIEKGQATKAEIS